MAETHQAPTFITIQPSPGISHLIPLVQFARKLVQYHHFSVTFIIPTDAPVSKAQRSLLDSLPKSMKYIILPPVNLDDLPQDAKIETRIQLTVARSLPSLREAFKLLTASNRVSALVTDLFGTESFNVVKEFNVSPYIFYPTSALSLAFFLHLPKLDEMYSCEYKDMPEQLQLPGCVPLHGAELMDPVQDRKNDAYKWLLHNCKNQRLAEGILINSFVGLESAAIKALKEDLDPTIPPVYPIGPLIQSGSRDEAAGESECLKWLDDQPSGSVLFVSFGSGGALSPEQMNELAFGLELSEQKFLWVVKSPTLTAAGAQYLTTQSIDDPCAFLPKGFMERTKGQGMLVPSWAPQIQVLSHGSTGGFLTHCGWNSILESVVHGVPFIAWPLYAEQKMNAKFLVEGMKVALTPKAAENGIIRQAEIATVVRCLMEGEEGKKIRNRMKVLEETASMMLSEDGSSTKSLSEVANKWKAKVSM